MPRGAHHPTRTPDDEIIRKHGGKDGRCGKRKHRVVPYYVRLDVGTYDYLESLLDVPWNHEAGTAVRGCSNRADVIQVAFNVFDRINEFAREMNVRDIEALIDAMIDAVRGIDGQAASQTSLMAPAPTAALPAPRDTNS